MSKLKNRNSAFTLIEVLVVLVILSIVMTFAVLATGDFGASRRQRDQLEQLQSKLQFAQQQAVLMQTAIGARIDPDHYQFLQFVSGKWQVLNTLPILSPTKIHDAQLRIVVTWIDQNEMNPQIIFTENADATPFTIELRNSDQQAKWKLVGNRDGSMKIDAIT